MKRFLFLTVLGIALNGAAQSVLPASVRVENFTFAVSEDSDSGMDLLTVTKSKNEKICTYLSNRETSERFLFTDPDQKTAVPRVIRFKKAPTRFFITEWSLPSDAAKLEVKILDTAQKGGTCSFVGADQNDHAFMGLAVNLYLKKNDVLKITEVSARNDDSTDLDGTVTECALSSTKLFHCGESKTSPYLPGNP